MGGECSMKTRRLHYILFGIFLLLLISKTAQPVSAALGFYDRVTIRAGSSKTLQVPAYSNTSLKWETTDRHIAVVNSRGRVTGKARGTATIYATTRDFGYHVAEFSVEVKPKARNYKKIYKNYAKKLKKKLGTPIYMAIVKSDEPILLISDHVYHSSYYGSGYCSFSAKIYQYVKSKKKVVYVGTFTSGGTGHPLCQKGKYIQRGYHHEACQIRIKKGKATGYKVSDVYMADGRKAAQSRVTIKKGKWKSKLIKKVSASKGEALDAKYYTGKKVIKFKAVK